MKIHAIFSLRPHGSGQENFKFSWDMANLDPKTII